MGNTVFDGNEAPDVPVGAIDCDVHCVLPKIEELLPYFDEDWRAMIISREIFVPELTSYPSNIPTSRRPEAHGLSDIEGLRANLLDRFGLRYAIVNCIGGFLAFPSEDMSAAFCNAANSWVAATYLDAEPRLRASVVISLNNPALAVKEIELRASDRRFVQILVLANGDRTLGRREHWPVFAAAEKHQMPIAVHLGSLQRFAPTQSGFPSSYVEDYSGATQSFATAVLSLLAEGVFGKFPSLKFVLSESGITWLPSLMWRVSKEWRGTRLEIPWVKESPATLVRRNIRMTLQPFDAPPLVEDVTRILDHLGGGEDMILFSTDYPHDHFDGDKALPAGLPAELTQKIVLENPLATYPRLGSV